MSDKCLEEAPFLKIFVTNSYPFLGRRVSIPSFSRAWLAFSEAYKSDVMSASFPPTTSAIPAINIFKSYLYCSSVMYCKDKTYIQITITSPGGPVPFRKPLYGRVVPDTNVNNSTSCCLAHSLAHRGTLYGRVVLDTNLNNSTRCCLAHRGGVSAFVVRNRARAVSSNLHYSPFTWPAPGMCRRPVGLSKVGLGGCQAWVGNPLQPVFCFSCCSAANGHGEQFPLLFEYNVLTGLSLWCTERC